MKDIISVRNLCKFYMPDKAKVFFSLFFIKLAISFNYAILNTTKDTIIVTTSGGAELIPVLKGGLVLIVACIAMLLFNKLANLVTKSKLFYIVVSAHLLYFLLFGFFLFPYRELLTPLNSAEWLLNIVGVEHKHWVSVYTYWMNALFFVSAELWGGLVIGVLFWGYANYITSVGDAAKFYGFYAAGGHVGAIIAGIVLRYSARCGEFGDLVSNLMLLVCFVGFGIMLLFKLLANKFISHEAEHNLKLDKRSSISLTNSLKFILRSKYLWLIAVMVVGYGLSINLVEVTWKAILKIQYPDSRDYQQYLGNIQIVIGFFSLIFAYLMSRNIVGRYGWYAVAQITPMLLLGTSGLFFTVYFMYPEYIATTIPVFVIPMPFDSNAVFMATPIMLLVFLGALHNVVCKSLKYSVFDTTKEMTYIPLDDESKLKGKAAVDLVGARLGKSGSSWLQLIIIDLVGAGSVLGITYLIAPCVLFVVCCWLLAVSKLNPLFINQRNKSSNAIDFKLRQADGRVDA